MKRKKKYYVITLIQSEYIFVINPLLNTRVCVPGEKQYMHSHKKKKKKELFQTITKSPKLSRETRK